MPLDSTANLLFSIGANSDDAEANIQKFRTLLGKDLGTMQEEFGDWAKEVFGSLSTVQGAVTAASAAVGAAMVALGAIAQEGTNKYAEFVTEVDRGSRVTGISTETMSGLKFAASETNTSYDSLVTGLTRFATAVVKASEGGDAQEKAFRRLGISQEEVKAGEKDLMPLLESVADRFQHMGSQVDKTATARDLFGRGGAELVRVLSMGSEGLREFAKEAEQLGLIITQKDVVAVNEYRAALNRAKAEQEAFDITIGKSSIGVMETLRVEWAGLIETFRQGHTRSLEEFFVFWKTNNSMIQHQIEGLAKSLAKLGDKNGNDPEELPKKLKENYSGLADLLTQVREKTEEVGAGPEGKIAQEIQHLGDEAAKATIQYQKLRAEGKLSAEDARNQSAALWAIPAALAGLRAALEAEERQKESAAARKAGEELQELTLRQGQETIAIKNRLLDLDVAKRRETLEKEFKHDADALAQNLAWLAAYEAAARQKIARDKIVDIEKVGQEISDREREFGLRSYEQQVADLTRGLALRVEKGQEESAEIESHQAEIEALRKAANERSYVDRVDAFNREMDLEREKDRGAGGGRQSEIEAARRDGLARIEADKRAASERSHEQQVADLTRGLALTVEKDREESAEVASHQAEILALRKAANERSYADRVATFNREMDLEREKDRGAGGGRQSEIEAARKDGLARIEGDERAASQTSYERKVADVNREMDLLAKQDRQAGESVENFTARIAALRKAGLDKVAAEEQVAFDQEQARLGEQLERINGLHQTQAERIAGLYQADVARFTAAEEKKSLAAGIGIMHQLALQQMADSIRSGLLKKEQADLQALHNSTGWQGVFGNQFAQTIRGNEALWREWATSTNQARMMVRVSLESLKENGQQAFEQFAQGEGAAIASSLVYSKTIGAAMKEALAATLESLSARALAQAIYSAGLGFLCLAEGDFPGAESAFTAAAIFGTVGAAMGLAGRGVAGKQGTGGGASGGAPTPGPTPGSSSVSQGSGSGGSPVYQGGTHVTINVEGHIIGSGGMSQLVSMINEQVVVHDQQLTATNTKTGVQTQQ